MKAAAVQRRRHMVRTRFRIYIIPIRWSTKRLHYYALVRPKWGTKSASGRSLCRSDVRSVAVHVGRPGRIYVFVL